MTWEPTPFIDMSCKVCHRKIEVSARFTVCRHVAKDGTVTKWIRCEQCQQKSAAITQQVDARVKPMERMKYKLLRDK